MNNFESRVRKYNIYKKKSSFDICIMEKRVSLESNRKTYSVLQQHDELVCEDRKRNSEI